ncbi:SRPBCC family protein [Pseudomonas sp. HR96]|uniref:SRPBCC family protein n=1 Tax=Pseudomonas sp. HR96 TaxID=1027966 RepID=UPI002A74F837|nr:SRPBCC family protein [Pseudomonas sp. HR96]WPP01547.1 SRPBCC family protein [Pseudomonas sp. HR96]
MPEASASLDLPVSAEDVWKLVGGFQSLPDWLPLIVESRPEEGGHVRHLRTADGAVVVERLHSYDAEARTYSYTIVEGPFPVSDYLATLKVEATGDKSCKVTWGGRFKPVGISDAEAEALFKGVYEGGLEALKAHYQA